LTLADGCDLVYALIVERLERHVLNERQCALLAQLGGQKNVRTPRFDQELARVNALLADEPRRTYDDEQAALIAALGLGNGG
jgi:hypothetical protein